MEFKLNKKDIIDIQKMQLLTQHIVNHNPKIKEIIDHFLESFRFKMTELVDLAIVSIVLESEAIWPLLSRVKYPKYELDLFICLAARKHNDQLITYLTAHYFPNQRIF